uniref:Uncharacterized protein n=1 Tax=Pithovirus LCPAC304 TaxID=2506594 RepID=A0A481Z9Y8_9VIRU|nr:MAG: hypothetical protein LCPAC304_05290 [Pithovirus LCPAC304]
MSSVSSNEDTISDSEKTTTETKEVTTEAKEAIKESIVGELASRLKVLDALTQLSTDKHVADVDKISQKITENPIIDAVVELFSGFAASTGNVEKLNEYPAKERKEKAEREEACESVCTLIKSMAKPMDELQKGEKSFGDVMQQIYDNVTDILEEIKVSKEESKD